MKDFFLSLLGRKTPESRKSFTFDGTQPVLDDVIAKKTDKFASENFGKNKVSRPYPEKVYTNEKGQLLLDALRTKKSEKGQFKKAEEVKQSEVTQAEPVGKPKDTQAKKSPSNQKKKAKKKQGNVGKKEEDFDAVLENYKNQNEQNTEVVLREICQKYDVVYDPKLGVNSEGPNRATVFLLACLHGNVADVKTLLSFGANKNAVDSNLNGAFHYACRVPTNELVGDLSLHNRKQDSNSSTLTKHQAEKAIEIIRLLKKEGVDNEINNDDNVGFAGYFAIDYLDYFHNEGLEKDFCYKLGKQFSNSFGFELYAKSSNKLLEGINDTRFLLTTSEIEELIDRFCPDDLIQNYSGKTPDHDRMSDIRNLFALDPNKSTEDLLIKICRTDFFCMEKEMKVKMQDYYQKHPDCPSLKEGFLQNPNPSFNEVRERAVRLSVVLIKDLIVDNDFVSKEIILGESKPMTLFAMACKYGNYFMAEAIFNEALKREVKPDWNLNNTDCTSALHSLAIANNKPATRIITELLKQEGVLLDQKDPRHGLTPLEYALKLGCNRQNLALLSSALEAKKPSPEVLPNSFGVNPTAMQSLPDIGKNVGKSC